MIETTFTLQWFATNERLPEDAQYVFVRMSKPFDWGIMRVLRDGVVSVPYWDDADSGLGINAVTHWAALPVLGPEVFAEDSEALFLEWVAERQVRRKGEGNVP